MNSFAERYQRLSNHELLRIAEGGSAYQPEALEAARIEIGKRNWSNVELESAQSLLAQEVEAKRRRTEAHQERLSKPRRALIAMFERIPRFPESKPATEAIVLALTLVSGLMVLYQIYNNYGIVLFLLKEGVGAMESILWVYIIPLILLPSITVLFGLRTKIGWVLLVLFLGFAVVHSVLTASSIITWQASRVSIIDAYFFRMSTQSQLASVIFFATLFSTVVLPDTRKHFHISNKTLAITLGLSAAFTALILSTYF